MLPAQAAMAQTGDQVTSKFDVTSVTVALSESTLGQKVTITANVKNSGDATGTYSAALLINGKTEGSKDVTLTAGEAKAVEFEYTPTVEGTYNIEVGGKKASLKVVAGKLRVGPTVVLRPVEDEITIRQDGLVELYIDNPSLNEATLHVDLRVSVPSGLHVYGQGFGLAGAAGTMYGQLDVRPGSAQTVYMNVKASESAVGKTFYIHFSGIYYAGENKDLYNPISLTHPITITQASPEPESAKLTNSEQVTIPSNPSGWPWWAWVVIACVVLGGIATIFAARARHTEVSIEK
jgi:hypothetical protein